MEEIIKEEFEMWLSDIVNQLHQSESNYNNADDTSGQQIHTEEEIETLITKTIKKLLGCNVADATVVGRTKSFTFEELQSLLKLPGKIDLIKPNFYTRKVKIQYKERYD